MPPKRSMVNKPNVKDNTLKGKHPKSGNNTILPKDNQMSLSSKEAQMFLLHREKSRLVSKIQKMKKDLFEIRAALKKREFQALQEPEKKEQKFLEFSKNVDVWSKSFGIAIDRAVYTKHNSRKWRIEASGASLRFEVDICCATNEITKKGFIKELFIETTEPCKHELQPWFDKFECNIQQIFKVLKVYDEMNRERETGLRTCKEEFGSIITVYQLKPSGETVVELGNQDAYYFQIKWKLTPSIKHIAKVKNVCRIACTEEGDKFIKASTDLSSIKRRLGESPIDVIQLLARGLAKRDKSENV
ncbi:uncharacterized protein LOC116924435 [Daphnia magna]|uniref:uncharacterized protein LOC116924435 n=1 Tax=Daphnia magna TaxID=35525 RepID=UPI001E1BB295|nr:uncharacterized protein LOC116924435 [Daphnia magna]